MRGLEKNYMKRGHQRNKHTRKERKKQTNKHTSRLLDQLGAEGQVGENPLQDRNRKIPHT